MVPEGNRSLVAGGLWEEVVAEQKGQTPTGMWGKQDSASRRFSPCSPMSFPVGR